MSRSAAQRRRARERRRRDAERRAARRSDDEPLLPAPPAGPPPADDLEGFREFRRSRGPWPTVWAVLLGVAFALVLLAWSARL